MRVHASQQIACARFALTTSSAIPGSLRWRHSPALASPWRAGRFQSRTPKRLPKAGHFISRWHQTRMQNIFVSLTACMENRSTLFLLRCIWLHFNNFAVYLHFTTWQICKWCRYASRKLWEAPLVAWSNSTWVLQVAWIKMKGKTQWHSTRNKVFARISGMYRRLKIQLKDGDVFRNVSAAVGFFSLWNGHES